MLFSKPYAIYCFMCGLTYFCYYLYMESNDLFNILHNAVEAQYFGKKISQKEMAERLGVSMRTYQDWRLGNSKPQAVPAIFKMLAELDEEDLVHLVRKISKGFQNDQTHPHGKRGFG